MLAFGCKAVFCQKHRRNADCQHTLSKHQHRFGFHQRAARQGGNADGGAGGIGLGEILGHHLVETAKSDKSVR